MSPWKLRMSVKQKTPHKPDCLRGFLVLMELPSRFELLTSSLPRTSRFRSDVHRMFRNA